MLWSLGFIVPVSESRKSVHVKNGAVIGLISFVSHLSVITVLHCLLSSLWKQLFNAHWFMYQWLHYGLSKSFFQAFFLDFNFMYFLPYKTFFNYFIHLIFILVWTTSIFSQVFLQCRFADDELSQFSFIRNVFISSSFLKSPFTV